MIVDRKMKKLIDNQSGFTLVEIIAVFVILGILAAVAIPKYFELQAEVKSKAMDAALAEAVVKVNQYFAQQILQGEPPDQIVYDETTIGTKLGDFSLQTVDNNDSTITLTIVTNSDTQLANEPPKSRVIPKPGSP